MDRDASFTFLHRVEEIELNIEDRRWQSALALALTLPDICGGIAFPDLVRRYRDGRVVLDRQKNPARDVGAQYVRWFDEYAAPYFMLLPDDERPYIHGERCWQLRCEYLHQNKGFLNDEESTETRFHLGVNCGTSICQIDTTMICTDSPDIRIDIEQFCRRMCQAARSYYDAVHMEKDFSLYNTPVLDFFEFTQARQENGSAQDKQETGTELIDQSDQQDKSASSDKPFRSDSIEETEALEQQENSEKRKRKTVVIIHSDVSYLDELKLALQDLHVRILAFETPDIAARKLGWRRVDLWIVAEEFGNHPKQPWKRKKKIPLIFLADSRSQELAIQKNDRKWIVLSAPVQQEILRAVTGAYLK